MLMDNVNTIDVVEVEQKIHHWSNVISRAAIPHKWTFGVGTRGSATEHWPGIAVNNTVRDKMLDIILTDSEIPFRTRIEIMDEACDYIASVVHEKNFPDRVMDKMDGSQALCFTKFAEYIYDVYSVHYHYRLNIGKAISQRLSEESKNTAKNKM